MFNPTYLQRSRHGVFYFRWPLPLAKGATNPSRTIKLSLRTREPRLALRLAMWLSYLARENAHRGPQSPMNHKELRTLLAEHFGRYLAAYKARIDASGPLEGFQRQLVENGVGVAQLELDDGPLSLADDNAKALKFVQDHSVKIEPGSAQFEAFKRSYKQAERDYLKATLAYSDSMEQFEFQAGEQTLDADDAARSRKVSDDAPLALHALVDEYWKFAKLERRWIGKTDGEKIGHLALLYEVLGKDVLVASVGRTEAHRMRTILVGYPVNRNKLRSTRGKPLAEVLDLPGAATLHIRTINKYLQTYSGLFGWATKNGYCASNPFEGLPLRTDRADDNAPRLSFSDEQLEVLTSALLATSDPNIEHHKWGTLIGIHTGARLNEIAQLYLEDVSQVGGIWCFDINRKAGTLKKLKNDASKRVVPIHPKLLEYGFLDYLHRMKMRKGNERLFPQLSYTKADGFGRNLGRWVNETLLPDLNLKTKQLTFHSLRHTMVRRLIAADVSQAHIMAIVGHEPGTTTLKTYNRDGFPAALLFDALTKAI